VKAALVTGRQQLDFVDFDPPRPSPTGVVVDITYCGICGTDVASYRTGHLHSPAVCGHEWTGTISAAGSDVGNIAEGDRVVIGVAPPCGRCEECVAGRTEMCRAVQLQVRGRDAAAPPHGGFAAAIGVEADRVVPAHPDLTDEDAAQVEPAAVAYHGVRRSGLRLGDVAVVQGAGPIGLLTMQFARAAGATSVIAVEPAEHRRAKARELGAHHAVEPGAPARELVLDVTNGSGADVVYECAGLAPLVQTAVDLTRRGGVMTMLGYIAGEATISTGTWLGKDIRVVASTAFAHEDLRPTMSLLADGRVRVAPLHTRTIALDELDSVLADLAAGRADDTKVLVDPRLGAR
jgi:(R,R)-butanediol dehydrogenase/meso-butanediol dehydrogenase/diacetyl reductase